MSDLKKVTKNKIANKTIRIFQQRRQQERLKGPWPIAGDLELSNFLINFRALHKPLASSPIFDFTHFPTAIRGCSLSLPHLSQNHHYNHIANNLGQSFQTYSSFKFTAHEKFSELLLRKLLIIVLSI